MEVATYTCMEHVDLDYQDASMIKVLQHYNVGQNLGAGYILK